MRSRPFVLILLLILLAPRVSHAALSDTGFLANGKEVFRPLLADPREVQLALRLVMPLGKTSLGEIAAGDYFGLYRWALPWQESYVQWSVAGGMFARFDLVSKQKDLQAIDFSAEMPVDIRLSRWSIRLLPYHQSSHLGDDYIKRTGITADKYTFDSYKTLVAFEPTSAWRIYGGHNYIIRNGDHTNGRNMLQAGLEWSSAWFNRGHMQGFVATDFQSWERIGWNPISNSQAGMRFARHPEAKQRLALFTEYGTGHMVFGQFYQQEETHWVLAIRFELL